MKLRFVKFLTSRENEIEKKEEGEVGLTSRALPSLSQAAAIAPLPPSSFHHSVLLSLHPAHQPASSYRPACQPPRVGRAISSSYPSPAVPSLPFFFIKLPKQQSVERRTVAGRPAYRPSCPTQR